MFALSLRPSQLPLLHRKLGARDLRNFERIFENTPIRLAPFRHHELYAESPSIAEVLVSKFKDRFALSQ